MILLCDGDLARQRDALKLLVEEVRAGRADLAVAAFARASAAASGWALGFARWAIRARCGYEASAPISGQRALRAEVLPAVVPFAPRFGMEIGMTIDAVRAGFRVSEVELAARPSRHRQDAARLPPPRPPAARLPCGVLAVAPAAAFANLYDPGGRARRRDHYVGCAPCPRPNSTSTGSRSASTSATARGCTRCGTR